MNGAVGLTLSLMEVLLQGGADLVGVGDLTELLSEQRYGFPFGTSAAVKYPKEIIKGIHDLPTPEYKQWYDRLNERLDELVSMGAAFLKQYGYQAVAKSRAQVGSYDDSCVTLLPHKTVATRAGLGWVGKCALLITEQYGSMIRLSSILTDAPLTAANPINQSKCGECTACQNACPAGTIHGVTWRPGIARDELFDYKQCRTMAQFRSAQGFGKHEDLCGKCIEVCPYTKRYIEKG